MKILIDIDELEQSGAVTSQLATMLRTHAIRDTGSTAINMLLAFGAIAIAAGLLSLIPSSGFAALFGAGFILLGWLAKKQYAAQWGKLASIWMITGALVLSGSVGIITNQPFITPLIAAAILAFVSVIAESRLLIALVPLALGAAIGGSTGYWHACYEISIKEPTLTIVLFSALAYGAWQLAKPQTGLYQSLAIVFARMCIILVNFGFWIGSLWGDTPGKIWNEPNTMSYFNHANQQIPEIVFIVGWAVALVFAGAWGAKHGRRFMVNTVAVFGAIHFYTQWFEYIGLHAVSVIVAGVATVAFGLGLWRYNRKVLSDS
jgi:hypothetical protein